MVGEHGQGAHGPGGSGRKGPMFARSAVARRRRGVGLALVAALGLAGGLLAGLSGGGDDGATVRLESGDAADAVPADDQAAADAEDATVERGGVDPGWNPDEAASPPPATPAYRVVDLPTQDRAGAASTVVDGVVLDGDPGHEGGCLWVRASDGGERHSVLWPPGSKARFFSAVEDGRYRQSFALLDGEGAVVAEEGDALVLGVHDPESPPSLERCDVGGDLLVVDRVERADGDAGDGGAPAVDDEAAGEDGGEQSTGAEDGGDAPDGDDGDAAEPGGDGDGDSGGEPDDGDEGEPGDDDDAGDDDAGDDDAGDDGDGGDGGGDDGGDDGGDEDEEEEDATLLPVP